MKSDRINYHKKILQELEDKLFQEDKKFQENLKISEKNLLKKKVRLDRIVLI